MSASTRKVLGHPQRKYSTATSTKENDYSANHFAKCVAFMLSHIDARILFILFTSTIHRRFLTLRGEALIYNGSHVTGFVNQHLYTYMHVHGKTQKKHIR